jgi:hypothetical protein
MKWLTREPWRDAFADVLEQHVAGPCEAAGIESIEELGERVGAHQGCSVLAVRRS